jgi:hypothetical protein
MSRRGGSGIGVSKILREKALTTIPSETILPFSNTEENKP